MNSLTRYYLKFRVFSFLEEVKGKYKKSLPQDKPRCFVFLAADYGNLGDVAITYSQEAILKEKYTEYEIVDVPISETLSAIPYIRRHVKPDDIITITGGGNMSDMYYDIELFRLLVVRAFPKNKVIVFPQSYIMSDTKEAVVLQKLMKKIYSGHRNLTIFAREQISFDKLKNMLPDINIVLTPDIVMTYMPNLSKTERKGLTLCLRKDKEKSNDGALDELLSELVSKYDLHDYDTHIGRNGLLMEERVNELNKIWTNFSQSEWVITDRLHGMIFAFITKTPAIVLSNTNHKIAGCYEWIKDCGYIHYLNNTDKVTICKLIASPQKNNSGGNLQVEFQKQIKAHLSA